jgi:putative membrane protein
MRGRSLARLLAIATFALAFAVLDAPAQHSFAAHMTQHMLLVVVLAPLLVLGWAPRLPPRWTRGLAFVAAAVSAQVAALVFWHVPLVFDAAAARVPLHAIEHLTLVAAATAAWWVILASPVNTAVRFAACVAVAGPMLLLGALLTFAPTTWYAISAGHITDQQVGGAIMWGPAGIAYVIAAAWLVSRAIIDDERFAIVGRG